MRLTSSSDGLAAAQSSPWATIASKRHCGRRGILVTGMVGPCEAFRCAAGVTISFVSQSSHRDAFLWLARKKKKTAEGHGEQRQKPRRDSFMSASHPAEIAIRRSRTVHTAASKLNSGHSDSVTKHITCNVYHTAVVYNQQTVELVTELSPRGCPKAPKIKMNCNKN